MSPVLDPLEMDVEESYERRARLLRSRRALTAPSSTTAAGATVDTDELWHYCREGGLVSALACVLRVVGECFPRARGLGLRLVEDHEVGDEWVAVDITVPGSVEEFMQAYAEYTRRVVSSVEPDEWLRIRLSYHLV